MLWESNITLSRHDRGALLILLLALACASEREAREAPPAEPSSAPATSNAPATTSSAAIQTAIEPPKIEPKAPSGPRCREQRAQDFLLRAGQIAKIGASASEQQQIESARQRSIDYRTRHYGRFPGFGKRSDNRFPPSHYAKRTTFMGRPLVVHEKVVPALACVEAALERDCSQHPYRPRYVSGLRLENTYKDYEVSNHVYGIAIDIDSDVNPCCNCVGKWSESPLCNKKVSSVFERMAMPKCWVEVFERHGFHWLGHDELEDTMHFEFLGDPERVHE